MISIAVEDTHGLVVIVLRYMRSSRCPSFDGTFATTDAAISINVHFQEFSGCGFIGIYKISQSEVISRIAEFSTRFI